MAEQEENEEEKRIIVAKNAAELQKIRLEKLMKNPAKPAFIPEPSKDYKPRDPLEFIRNIWGSSAGAGSGDFHVYRGVRRREYARQKFAKEKSEKEQADEAYKLKVEENLKAAEDRTAKKRAKRQKKKQKMKNKKIKQLEQSKTEESSEGEADDNIDAESSEETTQKDDSGEVNPNENRTNKKEQCIDTNKDSDSSTDTNR